MTDAPTGRDWLAMTRRDFDPDSDQETLFPVPDPFGTTDMTTCTDPEGSDR